MSRRTHISSLLILLGFAKLLCSPALADDVDFVHEVTPILREHCAECHMGAKKKGGLSMNSRADFFAGGESGAIATPGDSTSSRLIQLITTTDPFDRMPPQGDRVSASQIATLRAWIDQGMTWEPGFTFVRDAWKPTLELRDVTLPPARPGRFHPVDRLLDAYLARDDHAIPAPVSDDVFLRRSWLDAVGLLPSIETLDAFLADEAPDKRSAMISRLLADDIAYADHWLTFWNDLLRNDYTGTGFITGGRQRITPWLYASLRNNKPYDQFARELLAPNSPDSGTDGFSSAGFILGIRWRGDVNVSQSVEIQFAQNVSQVFLGINLKCASCHDSFVDDWKLADAYDLAAVYAERPLELHRCDKPTGRMAAPRWIFPELGTIDPSAARNDRLEQLAGLLTSRRNARFARTIVNRVWHRLMGRGIVHPVDAMDTKPWHEDLLDHLAHRFIRDGYDLRKLVAFIMTSQAYQSETVVLEREPRSDAPYRGPIARRMTAEQLVDSVWQITGAAPSTMAAKVDRRESSNEPAQPELEATAQWIWSYPNTTRTPAGESVRLRRRFDLDALPTAAFVVLTCDNEYVLRVNGIEVGRDDDWPSVERLDLRDRLRTGSNTIEVTGRNAGSAPNPAGLRLEAHLEVDGHWVAIVSDSSWEFAGAAGEWSTAAVITNQNFLGGGVEATFAARLNNRPTGGGDPGRRPIRAALVANDFLQRSLGRPHREQVVTTRPATLTTLQAIDLTNGAILGRYLAVGARNLLDQHQSAESMIDSLYRAALSRAPTAGDRAVSSEVLGDEPSSAAVEDLLWTIFMLPEFQIIR